MPGLLRQPGAPAAPIASDPPPGSWATRPQPVEPSDEPGWGPEYEIEDGAALLFPPELLGDD